MTIPTHGLTLGKFAPLHRGHQLLIETALTECERVTVLIYDCPDTTDVPLPVRSAWIRTLYPAARVIECWGGPSEVGDTPEIRRRHEEYVVGRLGIRGITHFYSGEFYGEHMSRALGAADRRVDPGRERVPVSGTAIRSAPYAHRRFLHPLVYRDLVIRVVLLGAPCTGKTTLAERLAAEHGTVWMPEYGREYWERRQVGRRLTPEQLVEIAEGHLDREERLAGEADRYLFVDTNAWTTCVFARWYHGAVHPRLAAIADAASHRCDLAFLCGDDIPYDDTWDRSGEGSREMMQQMVIADLATRRIPYRVLHGGLEERVRCVREVLARFRKWGDLAVRP